MISGMGRGMNVILQGIGTEAILRTEKLTVLEFTSGNQEKFTMVIGKMV